MENQQEINNNNNNKEEESNKQTEEEKKLVPDVDPIRVMLFGLNNYTTDKQIVKFFANTFDPQEIQVVSVYKQLNQNYAVVTFQDEIQKLAFLKKLEENNYMLRKKKLKAKEATIDRMILRKEKKVCKILQEPKQNFHITEEEIEEIKKQSIQDKVCPLWKTDYKDQIKQKSEELAKILSKITQTTKRQLSYNDRTPNWVKNSDDGPCCKLQKFIECDENNLFYYRNKSEMTIGYNTNNEISVGYNKGRLDKGLVFVEKNALCPLSSKESIQVSELLEEIINKFKESYGIEPYQKFKATGFWRYLVVRQSDKTKEMIIEIVVNSESIPQDQLTEIKSSLTAQFTALQLENSMQLKSLGLLYYNGRSDAIPFDISPELLIGESCTYKEIILDKTFKVSVNSFLQVNTPQCEKLYSAIKEEAGIDQDTVLLDLYSGIGTIGICIGDQAKKIIAIEIIPQACKDSEQNAKDNNLKNFECLSAKVEEEIQNILKKESITSNKLKFVAIVDPPRSGLLSNVAKSLRTCKGLDKLIYVSCNPAAINDNILTLCLPENKKHKAPPFTPVKAIGVDLFPQTHHFELVLVLERLYD